MPCRMRRLIVLFALLFAVPARAELHPYLQKATVAFRPLPPAAQTSPVNPDVRYIGGFELEARDTDFLTGLSDLQLVPEGDSYRAEAISDYGAIALFTLKPDGKGGFRDSDLSVDPLRDEDGKPYYDKQLGDSEDIAFDPTTGAHYVAFEGYQRVMRYADWHGRGETLRLSGLPPFPSNEGMEGLAYIRGEPRISNFLLWQAAYSELVFVPTYWPDFDRTALENAIIEYRRRERRFGGLIARTGS